MTRICWVPWGTGTLKDRDEVNRREFWVCDGWMCDLESTGVPSIFSKIRIFRDTLRTSGRTSSGEGREGKKTDREHRPPLPSFPFNLSWHPSFLSSYLSETTPLSFLLPICQVGTVELQESSVFLYCEVSVSVRLLLSLVNFWIQFQEHHRVSSICL